MRFGETVREFGLYGFGVIGTAAAFLCIALAPRDALTGWLAVAVLLQSVPVGGLVLLAMMQLIRGRWEAELRTSCEAAAGLWCLAALVFLPVLLGMGEIYDWLHAPLETEFQEVWLSVVPFALRTLLWFLALAVIARSQVGGRASEGASALALIVLTLGASLLAVDWFMSLDPKFHSSGFGLQVFALEMCLAYLVIVLRRLVREPGPQRPALLSGLLIVFLLLWLYFQFMPYLIIWSGNEPEGAKWYAVHTAGVWSWTLVAAGLLGMGPLLALFLPQVRRSRRALAFAATSALVGKCLEFAWFALPGRGPIAALTFLFALCGLGCLAAAYLAPGAPRHPFRARAAR